MSRGANLRYISVFSGIEAASVAADGMGWEALAFSEIEPFPCAVLAERYPEVANLGDITKVDWKRYRGKCDLVVGGSPCQSFSVAGKREGLSGASGLMWEYVRCVREVRPRWFLWENVPGALSSERGEAFRCLLSAMDELGYGMAWRVLDAQFFGVAQRRRRLFLVGRLGERPPTEVLFEPDCLRGCPASSREKRKELAERAGRGAEVAGGKRVIAQYGEDRGQNIACLKEHVARPVAMADLAAGAAVDEDMCGTLHVGGDAPAIALDRAMAPKASLDICHTLRFGGKGGSNDAVCIPINEMVATRSNKLGRGTGFGIGEDGDPANTISRAHPHAVAVLPTAESQGRTVSAEITGSLCARDYKGGASDCVNDGKLVIQDTRAASTFHQNQAGEVKETEGFAGTVTSSSSVSRQQLVHIERPSAVVRRLTPTECERLQGFPDGWTKVAYRGKPAEECPDGPRYKALGNSMAVPVMRWIFEGIEMVEKRELPAAAGSPPQGAGVTLSVTERLGK